MFFIIFKQNTVSPFKKRIIIHTRSFVCARDKKQCCPRYSRWCRLFYNCPNSIQITHCVVVYRKTTEITTMNVCTTCEIIQIHSQKTHSLWLIDTLTAIQHTIAMCTNKLTDTHSRHIFPLFCRVSCASADFKLCLPLLCASNSTLSNRFSSERTPFENSQNCVLNFENKNDLATEVICSSFSTRTLDTLVSVYIIYSTKHLRYIGLVNTL